MSEHRLCVCGNPIRLGGFRITVNRKRGVAHYLDHAVGSDDGARNCRTLREWTCAMVKPYPAKDEDKPWHKMLATWDAGATWPEKIQ